MSEWLEWLRQSDLYDGYAPGNVCFVFSSGPIAVNPIPATFPGFLIDNNSVILTDDIGNTNLVAA